MPRRIGSIVLVLLLGVLPSISWATPTTQETNVARTSEAPLAPVASAPRTETGMNSLARTRLLPVPFRGAQPLPQVGPNRPNIALIPRIPERYKDILSRVREQSNPAVHRIAGVNHALEHAAQEAEAHAHVTPSLPSAAGASPIRRAPETGVIARVAVNTGRVALPPQGATASRRERIEAVRTPVLTSASPQPPQVELPHPSVEAVKSLFASSFAKLNTGGAGSRP
jgi:hypothetical protein